MASSFRANLPESFFRTKCFALRAGSRAGGQWSESRQAVLSASRSGASCMFVHGMETCSPDGGLLVQRLSVPVVEVLDAGGHADAAEGDLVRAWVEAHVVRLTRAVREVRDAVRAGDDRVRDARAARPCHDMAGAELAGLLLHAGLRDARRRPQLEGPAAGEHDERLGLKRMAMRDRAALVRGAADPVQPGLLGAGREHLVAVLVERDVVERDDVRRPPAWLGELELADLGLDVPRVVGPSLDPDVAHARRARARQPAVLGAVARAEREHVEAIWAGPQRVLLVVGEVDEDVAGGDLADALVLPREPGA